MGLGVRLVIPSQDVLTAFDEMEHSQIHQSLQSRGVSSHDCAVVMRDLKDVQLSVTIPEAGTTEDYELGKGGIQGGGTTALCFRSLIESIVEPLVHEWGWFGYGARTVFDTKVNHLIWVDQFWLFSNC